MYQYEGFVEPLKVTNIQFLTYASAKLKINWVNMWKDMWCWHKQRTECKMPVPNEDCKNCGFNYKDEDYEKIKYISIWI